ncbi:MAG: hypothetical protein ACK56I_26675, partial [bacterium]
AAAPGWMCRRWRPASPRAGGGTGARPGRCCRGRSRRPRPAWGQPWWRRPGAEPGPGRIRPGSSAAGWRGPGC